ncbi:MAG TPA: alkaline phosphatase family protein [Candidatus Limnocylindrales bacterium]|nr:alkaline phosphatase family protein [Candidatus Limnocylindrales bacterium]
MYLSPFFILAALLIPVAAFAQMSPWGDYHRAVLVSWDGVRRDVLFDLLERSDPLQPCWDGGDVFPVATGRSDAQGNAVYTCLPALGGAVPFDAPEGSPAYAPFQMIASHTTNDGTTMTKPQHTSMLTGLNTETHGLVGNETKGPIAPGITIYEILMDAFDPPNEFGERDGTILRTHQSSDRKYVGRAIDNWARRSGALQVATGHGNGDGMNPGPLRHAERSFEKWKQDELEMGLGETYFFMFLHFKTTDWTGHRSGADSRAYRRVITETDRKLYMLMEMLRHYGWGDAAILVTTDHGFHRVQHARGAGRVVFNTWLGAHNVTLHTDQVPVRTADDYCASCESPQQCLDEPMPAEDAVPNVYVTSITPTLLDMFGVDWRTTTQIEGVSLYR